MDANGDGDVEHAEMISFFAFSGAELTDGEFEVVLESLKDAAASSKMLKEAEALQH